MNQVWWFSSGGKVKNGEKFTDGLVAGLRTKKVIKKAHEYSSFELIHFFLYSLSEFHKGLRILSILLKISMIIIEKFTDFVNLKTRINKRTIY